MTDEQMNRWNTVRNTGHYTSSGKILVPYYSVILKKLIKQTTEWVGIVAGVASLFFLR